MAPSAQYRPRVLGVREVARSAKARVRRAIVRLALGTAPDPRTLLALRYLHGDGIEIGALHGKLPVSIDARVRYVDVLRCPSCVRSTQSSLSFHS
jgi:hypothetical protein